MHFSVATNHCHIQQCIFKGSSAKYRAEHQCPNADPQNLDHTQSTQAQEAHWLTWFSFLGSTTFLDFSCAMLNSVTVGMVVISEEVLSTVYTSSFGVSFGFLIKSPCSFCLFRGCFSMKRRLAVSRLWFGNGKNTSFMMDALGWFSACKALPALKSLLGTGRTSYTFCECRIHQQRILQKGIPEYQ